MMPAMLGRAIGMIPMGLAVFCVVIYLIVSGVMASNAHQAKDAHCKIDGLGSFIKPNDKCTPGTANPISRAEVCRHKIRPDLPSAERAQILRQYGYRHWSGKTGELDHRIPFFLGGKTTEDNIWPEEGHLPNTKDTLENKIYIRVCNWKTMTPEKAREVFKGDWTSAYTKYRWP